MAWTVWPATLVWLVLAVARPIGAQQRSTAAAARQQVVPNVTGLRLDSAARTLRLRRLTMRIETSPAGRQAGAQDIVARQTPAAGRPVPTDRTVVVIVTVTTMRAVPTVVGRPLRDAQAILTRSGFRIGRVGDDDSANVSPGVVVSQNPGGGQQADTATRVALTVRSNRAQAAPMPDLTGLPRTTAAAIVSRRGLLLVSVDTSLVQVRPDTVVSQNPDEGTPVRAGDRVRFTVGAEPKPVAPESTVVTTDVQPDIPVVPDSAIAPTIVGLAITPARAELRSGDSVRFVAIATMNDGTRRVEPTAWSVRGGGTITTDGVFTAGSDSGEYDVLATALAGSPTATARVRVTSAPRILASVVVPDIVGLSRAQARAVASRAGFMLVLAPGQSARDADTVTAQFPRARSVVSNGSLVLMAEFSVAAATTRAPWMMWLLLIIPVLAIAGMLLWKKPPAPIPTPTPLAFPPITYTARARPPSFSIVERGSRRGLELALSVTNDPGAQTVGHVASTPR